MSEGYKANDQSYFITMTLQGWICLPVMCIGKYLCTSYRRTWFFSKRHFRGLIRIPSEVKVKSNLDINWFFVFMITDYLGGVCVYYPYQRWPKGPVKMN